MQWLCASLLFLTAPLAVANDQLTLVDFEAGTLGWSGPSGPGGATFVLPGAGLGGGAGLKTTFNDFGVSFVNQANPAFVGDYTQFDALTLSVDLLVNDISFFGSPVSRPWLVELRDFDSAQGGYPWTSVWYLFGDVSASPGWQSFAVTIDDPTSQSLPVGWGGYGAEDPVTFEPILPPGVGFADVLAGVDQIAFTTLQPGFFFGFTDFDLVLDNFAIATTGGAWCAIAAGSPGANGVPALAGYGALSPGSPFSVSLTHAAGNAAHFLALGSSQISLPIFGGTLVSSADLLILSGVTNPSGNRAYAFQWPPSAPSGTSLTWQVGVLDAAAPAGIALSNGVLSTSP